MESSVPPLLSLSTLWFGGLPWKSPRAAMRRRPSFDFGNVFATDAILTLLSATGDTDQRWCGNNEGAQAASSAYAVTDRVSLGMQ